MPFYQSILHGHGFHAKLDGESPVAGFYTGRKTFAADESQARKRFHELLLQEEKINWLMTESREAGFNPKIVTQKLFPISVWRYLFGSYPKGLILYTESGSDDSETDDENESPMTAE